MNDQILINQHFERNDPAPFYKISKGRLAVKWGNGPAVKRPEGLRRDNFRPLPGRIGSPAFGQQVGQDLCEFVRIDVGLRT